MRRTVKLPFELLAAAQAAAASSGRSLDTQIAYWAALGREREARLAVPAKRPSRMKLSEAMAGIDTPEGRRLALAFFRSGPFPHYEAAPGRPGLVVRIDAKGRRVVGRFVGRRFAPVR